MADLTFQISAVELYTFEHITAEVVTTIVEFGIAEPIDGDNPSDWIFDTNSAHWIKKAVRLYRDLEIDWVAVCMVIDLLKQKDQLQQENQQLRAQLQRFI